MNNFKNISNKSINISLGLNQLQQKGSLVYEYNPLRVFRINRDIQIEDKLIPKGSLVDLDTDLLNFDLNHPVNIVTQPSYDGSVNLILNDGLNKPKLINNRFSPTGMDTYKIVDREGDNDTNIYDEDTFETEVSLYKKVNNIVNLTFTGLSNDGMLPVGNYVFYFKLADADGNETDFIQESGIVTCHVGNLNDPMSIQGGIENENSHKSVNFLITSIDSSYDNLVVYYTRSSASVNKQEITQSFKIFKHFPIYNGIAKVSITGYEDRQEVPINDINVQYNVVDNAATQETCQNMLFLGNIKNQEIPYQELTDLSLRLELQLNDENNIGFVDQNYHDEKGSYEYYNVSNIYYKLGYWNDEIYRLGVVYIMKDYTLSPVFNLRGVDSLTLNTQYDQYDMYTDQGDRSYITYNKDNYKLKNLNENAKGVFRIKYSGNQFKTDGIVPLGFNIVIPNIVKQELKKYTNGFFLVRQKRIPTILCQAVNIGLDLCSHLPTIPTENGYLMERFLNDDRVITHNFNDRITYVNQEDISVGSSAICPEYELKQEYFNNLFTTSKYPVNIAYKFKNSNFKLKKRHLYNLEYLEQVNNKEFNEYFITGVQDDIKAIKGKNFIFSSRAGDATELFRFSYINRENKDKYASNLVRGSFGPYLGLENFNTETSLLNIRISGYDEFLMDKYYQIRYQDSSPFYAIMDRISWDSVTDVYKNIFRGDCFIGNFTHRMNRNFQDSSAPINDQIVDINTWKDNFDPNDKGTFNKVNRSDVNAVNIGHWITVKVCSNINLALRTKDYSYPQEESFTGNARGFYPINKMDAIGVYKIPESFVYNEGNASTTSDKYNYEIPNVPAIKSIFNTRIMFSDISSTDAFKNGYRVFKNLNYKDYSSIYGSLIRLIEWYGNLIAIYEHGVTLIPVNERTLTSQGEGGEIYINSIRVLPENVKVLSDMYGSQWSESIIKTPYGVYGIDTVAKKIWKTDGQKLETISDFKMQKFLNDNISLTESEKTPIIGIRNVKSHYNAFKKDVMFTFYDDLNIKEEKVWNLCYNEIMQKFTTFYSWIPSYSENINNIFFSFDRETSKKIAKTTNNYPLICICKNANLLTEQNNHIINEDGVNIEQGNESLLGILKINLDIPNMNISYEISDKRFINSYKIVNDKLYAINNSVNKKEHEIPIKVIASNEGKENVEGQVINIEKTIYGVVYINDNIQYLTTDFWKHGQAGLMKSDIKVTNWYGKQHPFEFEFIVVDNPSIYKIFDNLQIISNKAEPESFHFEIVGDSYYFSDDKSNMYYRQEATKESYQNLGSSISFDIEYSKIKPILNIKSTIFPLYYSRNKYIDKIEEVLAQMKDSKRSYNNLSGSEIKYDKSLQSFNIITHKGAYDIQKVGRLRGNMNYNEDKWIVEIPSLVFMQKNENWDKVPTLVFNWLPNDLEKTSVTKEDLPNIYDIGQISKDNWSFRKEARLRDKFIKIRVRYSGEKLAVITALKTIVNI